MKQYFIVQLGKTLFSVAENHAMKVCEVIRIPDKITPLSKRYLVGIFQLRGEIVTLLSLSLMLKKQKTAGSKIGFVIKKDNDFLCFEADKIIGVASDLKEIKLFRPKTMDTIEKAFSYKNKTVLELDIEKLLRPLYSPSP